jgi:DNA-binding NtrC family response regulator
MNKTTLLLVDDELSFLRSLRRVLWQGGYTNVLIEQNPSNVISILETQPVDVVLLDISMPEMDGMELLEKINQKFPQTPVIMVTAQDTIDTALTAIRLGAYEYLTKPPDINRLLITVRRALEKRVSGLEIDSLRKPLQKEALPPKVFDSIITQSPLMFKVFSLVEIFAPTNETILITGETGTGKDLIAQKIHQLSGRSDKTFVEVNVASISPTLFESALFGHEKGAFTGASSFQPGYFETANGGTIFLDEIGELPKELQGKLLRVIQYGEIYRLGNTTPIKLDIRIIAATNKNLLDAIEKNEFRADLYYRLNRGYIQLPPLRERKEDLPLLMNYFLNAGNKYYKKNIPGFSDNIKKLLNRYDFPGNIRELENVVLNSIAKTNDRELIDKVDLPTTELQNIDQYYETNFNPLTLEEVERAHIIRTMVMTNNNVQKAASILGISERTLQRKLKKIRI